MRQELAKLINGYSKHYGVSLDKAITIIRKDAQDMKRRAQAEKLTDANKAW